MLAKCLKVTFICLLVTISIVNGCTRAPTHLPHGRRTRGDNGYKLIVADGPNGYVPGKAYNSKFIFFLRFCIFKTYNI